MEVKSNSRTTEQDITESIEALRRATLTALNIVLRQIIRKSCDHREKLRKAALDILPPFEEKTPASPTTVPELKLSPSKSTRWSFVEVFKKRLESPNEKPDNISEMASDYNLALALAALGSALYKFMEVEGDKSAEKIIQNSLKVITENRITRNDPASTSEPLLGSLKEKVVLVDMNKLPAEKKEMWSEIQVLMLHIESIFQSMSKNSKPSDMASHKQSASSPASSPSKDKTDNQNKLYAFYAAESELESLVKSIEKVIRCACQPCKCETKTNILTTPLLMKQVCKLLNPKAARQMSQSSSDDEKKDALASLIEEITKAQKRSLINQRALLSTNGIDKVAFVNKLSDIVEIQGKYRHPNQDYITAEEQKMNDLIALHRELTKSTRAAMDTQRYELSERQELSMFLNSLSSRMDRLANRRMANQEAFHPETIRSMRAEDMEKLLDKMHKHTPNYNTQRCIIQVDTQSSN